MILSAGLKRIMEMVREMRIRNLVCTSCLCGPEVKPSPSLMDFHSGPHSGRQTEELGDGDPNHVSLKSHTLLFPRLWLPS